MSRMNTARELTSSAHLQNEELELPVHSFIESEAERPTYRHKFYFRGKLGYFDGNTLTLCIQLMTMQARVGETVETEVEGMPRKTYYIIEDKNRRECGYRWVSSTPPAKGSSNPNDLTRKPKVIVLKQPVSVGRVTQLVKNPQPVRQKTQIEAAKAEQTAKSDSYDDSVKRRLAQQTGQTTGLKPEPIASDVSVLVSTLHANLHAASCLADYIDRLLAAKNAPDTERNPVLNIADEVSVALKHVNILRTRLQGTANGEQR